MKDPKGSALIITVLIVAVLVALVVEFAYEVYIDTATLSNWSNAQKASLIAKSGQALSSKYIPMIDSNNTKNEIVYPVENNLGPNTQLIIKIEDENAKFNINNIIYEKGSTNDKALASLQKLFEYLNINPELALAIADWIDPDSEPRLLTSEENAKNTFLSTVDELKLIKGIDKDVFDKISPYLTAHEGRNRVTPFDTEININTAQLPVLMGLRADMTETLAQRIIDEREISPFKSTGQLSNILGTSSVNLPITVTSSNFRITSKATVNEITRIIESIVDRSSKIQFWREE